MLSVIVALASMLVADAAFAVFITLETVTPNTIA